MRPVQARRSLGRRGRRGSPLLATRHEPLILIVTGLAGRPLHLFVCLIKGRAKGMERDTRGPDVKACSLHAHVHQFLIPSPSQNTPLTSTPQPNNKCPSGPTAVAVPPFQAPCPGSHGRPRRALMLPPSVHLTQSHPPLALSDTEILALVSLLFALRRKLWLALEFLWNPFRTRITRRTKERHTRSPRTKRILMQSSPRRLPSRPPIPRPGRPFRYPKALPVFP